MRRVPALELIKQAIGWEPKISLDEALCLIVESERLKTKDVKP